MAKVKAGTVAVEIILDKDQFDKDFKRVGREVTAEQKRISLEMERNKIKFAVEGADKTWADKLFGGTVIGKIQNARKETAQLNTQIGLQKSKVDLARNAWAAIFAVRGSTNSATVAAERSYMREQRALAGLKKELDGTASAAGVMGGALVTAATVGVAAVMALAASYAAAVRSAMEWGQAVNDIADETGLADEEAGKLLGTMRIVGLSSEEAAGAIAKLSKNVGAAAAAQAVANKNGQESDDVFTKWGIAIKDADGALLSHSEIIANITAVHRSMSDGLAKTEMEMQIFGKTGYKLNDLLNMTSERSDEIAVRLAKMGLTVGVNSQKFEDLGQQLNEAKLALQSIANTIVEDDIQRIKELVAKFSDLAISLRENKDTLQEVKSAGFDGVSGMAYPIVKSFEMAADAVQKYLDLRQQAVGMSRVNNPPGDVTDENVATQNKNIDAARKKSNETVLARLKENQTVIDAAKELNTAIAELNGRTLEVQLANIDKEEKRWAEKTKNSAKASEWAEQARAKAFKEAQDRIDTGLKTYESALKSVQSAYRGIGSSFQGAFGSAISEVMDNLKNNRSADAYGAVQKVKDEYELRKRASREVASAAGYQDSGSGIFDPESPWQAVNNAFDALNKAITEADKAKLDYLKAIAQNTANQGNRNDGDRQRNDGQNRGPEPTYNQPQYGKMDAQGNIIEINIPVSIDGQQVGQAAAKRILPSVQAALQQNKTYFGGDGR